MDRRLNVVDIDVGSSESFGDSVVSFSTNGTQQNGFTIDTLTGRAELPV